MNDTQIDNGMDCGIPDDYIEHKDVVFAKNTIPQFWDLIQAKIDYVHSKGITGDGVVGCVMDTGYTPHRYLKKPKAVKNFTSSRDTFDYQGHGSWCNGRVFGEVGGIAPGAEWMHAKVLGDNGSGRTDWSESGRLWSAKQGAHILSVSIGGPCDNMSRLNGSMRQAYNDGMVLEFDAAGNAGYNGRSTVDCPGAAVESIAVASYNVNGTISNFSSGGSSVDLAGPGERVISLSKDGQSFSESSGTSMSTPFVAGLGCLLLQKRRQLGFSDDTIRGAENFRQFLTSEGIYDKAIDDAGAAGKDVRFGIGIFLIANLIDYLGDYENV